MVVFSLEVIIKVAAEGKKPLRYFRNPWNVFDFIIVAACLLEPVLPIDGAFLPVLRLARILRVLRLVTTIPKLQVLVTCLLKSLPSMFYVSVLLGLLFYVYGTMAVFLYGENDPIHFRNLQTSILSLFRVVTLEDWTNVYQYVRVRQLRLLDQDLARWEPSSQASPLGAAIFFVSFVLIGTMIVLNLVIGVIMNSMDESNEKCPYSAKSLEAQESPDPVRDGVQDLHQRLEELSSEMKVIKKMLEEIGSDDSHDVF